MLATAITTSVHTFNSSTSILAYSQQQQQHPGIPSTATTVSLHTLNSNNSILAYSQQQKRHLCILSTATTVSLHTRNSNSIIAYSRPQQHPCILPTATASFHTLNSNSKTLTRGRVSPSKSVQWKMIDWIGSVFFSRSVTNYLFCINSSLFTCSHQ